jgi:hypothetical protein
VPCAAAVPCMRNKLRAGRRTETANKSQSIAYSLPCDHPPVCSHLSKQGTQHRIFIIKALNHAHPECDAIPPVLAYC